MMENEAIEKDFLDEGEEAESKDMENAKRVRELYESAKATHGVTYDQLAEITGIPRNTLATWITLKHCPPPYVVELIELKLNEFKEDNPPKHENTWKKKAESERI